MRDLAVNPLRYIVAALIGASFALRALAADDPGADAAARAAATCPQGPPSAVAPTRPGMHGPRDHGFLWRISKGGRTSWLFGTLHVGRSEWALPGPRVLAALKTSDAVALEIDLLDPAMQQRLARAVAAQPRPPLPVALQQRLDRAAQAECVDPEALAGLAPELRIATLTALIGRRDGLEPDYGADIFLARWGHATQRRVVSLETPERQLDLLHGQSVAETIDFVDESLTEIENGHALPGLLHLAQVWGDADWTELSDYPRWCECLRTESDRATMKRMLDERNPDMAAAIAALHASGQRVFAAVGSLHMIGPKGLPALMAQHGYRVEQIVYDRPRETPP